MDGGEVEQKLLNHQLAQRTRVVTMAFEYLSQRQSPLSTNAAHNDGGVTVNR